MSIATFFMRSCPTCGRRLEVQVHHLGRSIVCPHCRSQFVASINEPLEPRPTAVDRVLRDAERYLATVEEWDEVAAAWENGEEQGSPR